MDNDATFHSSLLKKMFDDWKINTYYRVTNRASGNGVIERNHWRTETTAGRSNISPQEAVFWYKISPKTYEQKKISKWELFT